MSSGATVSRGLHPWGDAAMGLMLSDANTPAVHASYGLPYAYRAHHTVCEHLEKFWVAHPAWRHRFTTSTLTREYLMLVITDAVVRLPALPDYNPTSRIKQVATDWFSEADRRSKKAAATTLPAALNSSANDRRVALQGLMMASPTVWRVDARRPVGIHISARRRMMQLRVAEQAVESTAPEPFVPPLPAPDSNESPAEPQPADAQFDWTQPSPLQFGETIHRNAHRLLVSSWVRERGLPLDRAIAVERYIRDALSNDWHQRLASNTSWQDTMSLSRRRAFRRQPLAISRALIVIYPRGPVYMPDEYRALQTLFTDINAGALGGLTPGTPTDIIGALFCQPPGATTEEQRAANMNFAKSFWQNGNAGKRPLPVATMASSAWLDAPLTTVFDGLQMPSNIGATPPEGSMTLSGFFDLFDAQVIRVAHCDRHEQTEVEGRYAVHSAESCTGPRPQGVPLLAHGMDIPTCQPTDLLDVDGRDNPLVPGYADIYAHLPESRRAAYLNGLSATIGPALANAVADRRTLPTAARRRRKPQHSMLPTDTSDSGQLPKQKEGDIPLPPSTARAMDTMDQPIDDSSRPSSSGTRHSSPASTKVRPCQAKNEATEAASDGRQVQTTAPSTTQTKAPTSHGEALCKEQPLAAAQRDRAEGGQVAEERKPGFAVGCGVNSATFGGETKDGTPPLSTASGADASVEQKEESVQCGAAFDLTVMENSSVIIPVGSAFADSRVHHGAEAPAVSCDELCRALVRGGCTVTEHQRANVSAILQHTAAIDRLEATVSKEPNASLPTNPHRLELEGNLERERTHLREFISRLEEDETTRRNSYNTTVARLRALLESRKRPHRSHAESGCRPGAFRPKDDENDDDPDDSVASANKRARHSSGPSGPTGQASGDSQEPGPEDVQDGQMEDVSEEIQSLLIHRPNIGSLPALIWPLIRGDRHPRHWMANLDPDHHASMLQQHDGEDARLHVSTPTVVPPGATITLKCHFGRHVGNSEYKMHPSYVHYHMLGSLTAVLAHGNGLPAKDSDGRRTCYAGFINQSDQTYHLPRGLPLGIV